MPAPGSARSRACRRPRPGSSCSVSPAGIALGGHGPPGPVGDRRDDLLDRAVARASTGVVAAATLSSSVGGVEREQAMVEHARAVIIGGGVGGTSIAYHLAELGWTDIVLVDRAELTSGSTFHSAGLVGQLRSSVTLTKMMMYGTDLYRRLAAETGTDPSWHEVGSLRLASSPERFEELRRQAGWAKTFGLPLELITADGGPGPLPADVDRRRPRRGLAADRRLARPVRPGQRARGGRPPARRADPPAHPGRRRSARTAAGSPA